MLRVRVVSAGWSGGPGFSTWYFSPSAETIADADDVTGRVRAFYAFAAEYLPSSATWTVQPEVDVVNPATGDVTDTLVAFPAPAVVPGTKPPGILPPSNCAVLSLLTDTFIGGRRVRGRSFLGPISQTESINADGTLQAVVRARYAAGVAAMIETGGDPTPVVWHRPVSGAGGDTAPIVGCTVAAKLGVLRSRRD